MAFSGYHNPEVQIPQQTNPLELLARVNQIKSQEQAQQLQSVQLQQQQRALQDDTTIRESYGRNKGDVDKTLHDIAGKVSPQAFQAAQQHAYDLKQKAAALVQQQGDMALKQADIMQGAHDAVDQAPPEQKPAVYQQQIQGLQKMGIDVSGMPQQYPGDEQFKYVGTGIKTHKQLVEDALKAAETAKNVAQGKEAEAAIPKNAAQTEEIKANTAKIQAEMDFYKKSGLAPGVPLDAQEASDWMQKNPGKSVSDYMKMKATLVPAFNFNLQNTGTSGPSADVAKRFGMTPEAFDQQADKYWTTGSLPPVGRGGPSLALNKAIMNRAAELHPGESLAQNAAVFSANKRSLEGLQKQFDQVTAFENTAGKNLDVFLGTAKKVVDSGSPLINRPLRSLSSSMLGGEDQAAFNAARTTALTEIAKVLNSSNASGVLSDSARHEVESLIGPNATLGQIYKAAGILKQDMANRHDSYQQQIDYIKGRMRGGTKEPQKYSPPSGAPTAIGPNGHKIVVDGGKWVDYETGKPIQ